MNTYEFFKLPAAVFAQVTRMVIIMTWTMWNAVLACAVEDPIAESGQDVAATSPQQTNDIRRGTLTGRFVFDGEVPLPVELFPDSDSLQQPATNRVNGAKSNFLQYRQLGLEPTPVDPSLMIAEDGGIADVMIWVSSTDIPWSAPSKLPIVKVEMKNGNNSPRMVSAVVGQEIQFINRDPLAAHIGVDFNRPLNPTLNVILEPGPRSNPLKVVGVSAEKFPAHYRSNIAPWVSGAILIHHNSFVAVSDKSGQFSLPDLPLGEWEFHAWHARCGNVAHWPKGVFKQTIQSGINDLGTIKLKPERFGLSAKPDAAQIPAIREPVGQALGALIYRDQINDPNLLAVFSEPIWSRYLKLHHKEVTPTADEIRFATEYFVKSHAERLNENGNGDALRAKAEEIKKRLASEQLSEEATSKLEIEYQVLQAQLMPPGESLAVFILNNWKLQKHLYDNFGGGRILWQQAGMEAFDAMHNWLKAAEAKGDFSITDEALRAKFYSYWTRNHGSFLTADPERIRKEFLEPPFVAH